MYIYKCNHNTKTYSKDKKVKTESKCNTVVNHQFTKLRKQDRKKGTITLQNNQKTINKIALVSL